MLKIDDNIIRKMIEEDEHVDIEYIEVKPQNIPLIPDAPLKVCEEKFNNFKKHCLGIDAQNEWIDYFCKSVDLDNFLLTIRTKLLTNPSITIDEIYKDILETSKLSDEKVGPGEKDKTKRYITYFLTVAKSMD